jgi:hypothetical protein
MVVSCEDMLFLCIGEINGLFLDHQPVDDIPISVLSEKITCVSYQALHLVPASYSDDCDGKHDWRTSGLFSLLAKVPIVQPINPTVASPNLCDAFFLFESSALMALAAEQDGILHGHRKHVPNVKASDKFPYCEEHRPNLCDTFFLFESSALMALAADLQDGILCGYHKHVPNVKPSNKFPYQEQDGMFSCYLS